MNKIPILIAVLFLTSCNLNTVNTFSKSVSTSQINPITSDSSNDSTSIVENSIYQVYDKDDNLIFRSNNLWSSISKAASSSKSSNKHIVKKDNDIVYKYSTSKYYMYLSDEYIGETDNLNSALLWAKKYKNSYVIDGKASKFEYVGKEIITKNNLDKDSVRGVENMSGCYSYMFSTQYTSTNNNGNGYSYIEFEVEFSKAKLQYLKDNTIERGWNAYIFVNIMCDNPWLNCDMGIIQGWASEKGKWLPVFNHNGKLYSPDPKVVITQMKYDEESGKYYGVDDLLFKCYINNNNYCLYIKNMTSNVEYYYECQEDKLIGNAEKSYILLAASNCPDQKDTAMWNLRCENSFENVLFRNVLISKYTSDFNYKIKEDFYPDSSSCNYTIIMGAENASIKYDTDASGKYIIMNMINGGK